MFTTIFRNSFYFQAPWNCVYFLLFIMYGIITYKKSKRNWCFRKCVFIIKNKYKRKTSIQRKIYFKESSEFTCIFLSSFVAWYIIKINISLLPSGICRRYFKIKFVIDRWVDLHENYFISFRCIWMDGWLINCKWNLIDKYDNMIDQRFIT